MKKFMTYATNHKGMTLVMMAIMLPVLLIFASLAIDIAYMYYAKNQLQVAADSAALAGASKLDFSLIDSDTSAYEQLDARKEAWKFACKNRAAQRPVFLVTNTLNCDTVPSSGLNETYNTSTEDIVVGNWNSTIFRPADGTTDLLINAIRVAPRRSKETADIEMPAVGLFFGKIFTFFKDMGADWSFMNVRATATAAFFPAKVLPIAVNEYWLHKDALIHPQNTPFGTIHLYPNSFVRKKNVDNSSSSAWGKIFAFFGANANDNLPPGGSQNVNGYMQMDVRSSNHYGSGTSWYTVNTSGTGINCSNCFSGFNGPSTYNPGYVQSAKMDDESLTYLHEGYPYILPTAVREQYRSDYVTSNYVIPTSTCPFATIAYFSSSGSVPINYTFAGKDFREQFPKGLKVITMVYDGTFLASTVPNAPNALTIVGYILLQIDGYSSSNPKNLNLDQPTNNLGNSGNTAYAHALSDIVEPASPFGTCDETFFGSIRDLQRIGGEIKLVQ